MAIEHNFKNLKVTEDPKILQQILGKMPEAGNQVNIIYFNQIVQEGEVKEEKKFDLGEYLESLPQPRLKNLIRQARNIAYGKFPNDGEAGKWLGGSRRLINYRLKEREVNDEENSIG